MSLHPTVGAFHGAMADLGVPLWAYSVTAEHDASRDQTEVRAETFVWTDGVPRRAAVKAIVSDAPYKWVQAAEGQKMAEQLVRLAEGGGS